MTEAEVQTAPMVANLSLLLNSVRVTTSIADLVRRVLTVLFLVILARDLGYAGRKTSRP